MPNIRSMKVDDSGVVIVASDGRTFTILASQVKSSYDAQVVGTKEERKGKVRTAFGTGLVSSLGSEQIDSTKVAFEFDEVTGKPTNVTIENAE